MDEDIDGRFAGRQWSRWLVRGRKKFNFDIVAGKARKIRYHLEVPDCLFDVGEGGGCLTRCFWP